MGRRTRVFLDANTIISAFLFDGVYKEALLIAIENDCNLITSEYVLEEVNEVLKKKFSARRREVSKMLELMDLKVVPMPTYEECQKFLPILRDPKDVPVLTSAVKALADILLTGDKDFDKIDLKGIIKVVDAPEFIVKFN